MFAFLLITAIAIVRLRNLVAVSVLGSVFSLLGAGLFVVMDAVDVAFTEAAVGAGVSLVFFLAALSLTGHRELPVTRGNVFPLLAAVLTGALLIYGLLEAPPFGSADAPAHHHVAPEYLSRTEAQIGVPNIVSAVLASYRGFDTLGETGVIFTAGIGVLLLLNGGLPIRKDRE